MSWAQFLVPATIQYPMCVGFSCSRRAIASVGSYSLWVSWRESEFDSRRYFRLALKRLNAITEKCASQAAPAAVVSISGEAGMDRVNNWAVTRR